MALPRNIVKRLYNRTIKDQSPIISPSSQKALNAAKAYFHRQLLKSPDNSSSSSATADSGLFRRFLQRRKINQYSSTMNFPELFYFPVGEKLREKLNFSGGDRLRLEGLRPPTTNRSPDPSDSVEISVQEARKIFRCSQLQKVRSALQQIPTNSITYSEFLTVCSGTFTNHDQGAAVAKMLDEAGDVIVLGNVVFIRPDQVAKSMEKLILQSLAIPNDPKKHELEEFEKKKTLIDQKAISQVRVELYCGLGLLVVQTLGFMRLTFWELSWDVMEPICFFVTSLHFAFAYMFFLRTSNEPTFESYFQCRFKVKQRKLMEMYNFDLQKYKKLCEAFYPNYRCKTTGATDFHDPVHVGSSSMVFGKV